MRERREVAAAMTANGYAVVRRHKPDFESFVALSDFGEVESVEGLNVVQQLVPRDLVESQPNTYGGTFGTAEFPLHTDLAHWAVPPRFLALRCIRGSASVPTRLFDGGLLLKRFRPEVLRSLLVQPRRPMRNGKQLLQLLERVESTDLFRLRWDSVYLKPATSQSAACFIEVKAFIAQATPSEILLADPGDTLIIDNWRCLHGRAPVSTTARTRHIDRAYLREIS